MEYLSGLQANDGQETVDSAPEIVEPAAPSVLRAKSTYTIFLALSIETGLCSMSYIKYCNPRPRANNRTHKLEKFVLHNKVSGISRLLLHQVR
jgi:hypothetical protein